MTSYHTTYFAFFLLILLKQENDISQLGHGRCYSRTLYYLLAVVRVYHSQGKSFLILSDSLPSLRAISNMKYDRPILAKIFGNNRDGKEIVFVRVPAGSCGH